MVIIRGKITRLPAKNKTRRRRGIRVASYDGAQGVWREFGDKVCEVASISIPNRNDVTPFDNLDARVRAKVVQNREVIECLHDTQILVIAIGWHYSNLELIWNWQLFKRRY